MPVLTVVMEDSGELLRVPFYVAEKVPGHVIADDLPSGYATPEVDRVTMTDSLVDTSADLHAVDPRDVGLNSLGRPKGCIARQVRNWSRQWEASKRHDNR